MIDLLKRIGCISLAAMVATPPILAADLPTPATQGVVMPDTERWDIQSAQGQTYRIFVSRPKAPPPAEGYPVLYVLDGNAMWAAFAEERRLQEMMDARSPIGKAIVVGIGYPTDLPYDVVRRLYDFTPAWNGTMPASEGYLARNKTGGRDRFLDFLTGTLQPAVARRYATNPRRQSLFGHSLGGLFALHILYSHPESFNAIIAASPSQWWADQAILAEEQAFTARLGKAKPSTPARLLLVAGDREEREANVWDAAALAKRLEPLSAYGLRSQFELYKDEGHLSVPGRATTSALRWAFAYP